VQSVMTAVNKNAIWGVAELASELGATVMQVVPFESVRRPIAKLTNQDLFLESKDKLRQTVEDMASHYSNVRFELFEKLGTGSRSQFHCDIGMTKLFFLPDGSVHRCYKLVDDSTLIGKDLKTCSVAEAWHDPQFGAVISPSLSLYSSSACGACGRFGNCHSEGRCIYEASVNHGTYYGQDRSCHGPFPIHPSQQIIPLGAIQA
jgi:radical SAM protein with 4Fe4S-binding SPASM domain